MPTYLGQCDEARPACGKCVKPKRVCSGYTDGFDLVSRDQNQTAKSQVERRQKKTREAQVSEAQPRQWSPSSTAISPSLAEAEETHALSFFVSTFVLYPRDTSADRGFLELLPLLFDNLKQNSPLRFPSRQRLMFSSASGNED